MTVYVVIQSGVYRHAIGGVFASEQAAHSAAKTLLGMEPDDHHVWEVVALTTDTIYKPGPSSMITPPVDSSGIARLGWWHQRQASRADMKPGPLVFVPPPEGDVDARGKPRERDLPDVFPIPPEAHK